MSREREFIEQLNHKHRERYDTEESRAMLGRVMGSAFPNRWIWTCELTQNAVDQGATTLIFKPIENGGIQVRHNGKKGFDEDSVRALSRLGMSSKGARSVGFMGVGFKSVFARFGSVLVSNGPWRFRYDVDVKHGHFNDRHLDHLGAVLPKWDEKAQLEEPGWTCFEFGAPREKESMFDADVKWLREGGGSLAVLATQGLKHLNIGGTQFLLEDRGDLVVVIDNLERSRQWRKFTAKWTPNHDAIGNLLTVRERQDPTTAEDAAEYGQEREIVALVPLDSDGRPTPPEEGTVFATLPTEEKLPFGLHVHADWLVDITRNGLLDPSEHPWQRAILDRLPTILAKYLDWIKSLPASSWGAGLKVLGPVRDGDRALDRYIAQEPWREKLKATLQAKQWIPTTTNEGLVLVKPSDVALLPGRLQRDIGDAPELRPSQLFGVFVPHRPTWGSRPEQLAIQLGLVRHLEEQKWIDALGTGPFDWWDSLGVDERLPALYTLFGALAAESWDQAPVVPTEAGGWQVAAQAVYVNETLPSQNEPGGTELIAAFNAVRAPAERRVAKSVVDGLNKTQQMPGSLTRLREASIWLSRQAKLEKLVDLASKVASDAASARPPNRTVLLALGRWCLHRNRPDCLRQVLSGEGGKESAVPTVEALLADPYIPAPVGRAHRALFRGAVISSAYIGEDPGDRNPRDWRQIFERANARGSQVLQDKQRLFLQSQTRTAANAADIDPTQVGHSNNEGYTLIDREFALDIIDPEWLAPWLEAVHPALRGMGRRKLKWYYRRAYEADGKPCTWVQQLLERAWVPTNDGRRVRPSQALSKHDPDDPEQPYANLTEELIRRLVEEGVSFLRLPSTPALNRLVRRSREISTEEFVELFTKAADDDLNELRNCLAEIWLPLKAGGHCLVSRLVKETKRSSLGGWVAALGELDPQVQAAVMEFLPPLPPTTTGQHALGFLCDVWDRAADGKQLRVDEISSYIAQAFFYLQQDVSNDPELRTMWESAREKIQLYVAGRRWMPLSPSLVFDDLRDRALLGLVGTIQSVVAGHLGDTQSVQLATAKFIGLERLSDRLAPTPIVSGKRGDNGMQADMDRLCRVVDPSGAHVEVVVAQRLEIEVTQPGLDNRVRHPVAAWMDGDQLILAAGLFEMEGTRRLVDRWRLGQRGEDVSYVAACVARLGRDDFKVALRALAEQLGEEYDDQHTDDQHTDDQHTDDQHTDDQHTDDQHTDDQHTDNQHTDNQHTDDQHTDDGPKRKRGNRGGQHPGPPGKAPNRFLVQPNDADAKVNAERDGEGNLPKEDVLARELVVRYEKSQGRDAQPAAPFQAGYDVLSTGLDGTRKIEVKGLQGAWVDDATVSMTGRQFDDARSLEGDWWLYVVENLGTSSPSVLPIPNPAKGTRAFYLNASHWRKLVQTAAPKKLLGPDDEGEE